MCIRDRGADVNTFPSQSLLEHFTSHYLFLAELKTEVITQDVYKRQETYIHLAPIQHIGY